MTEERRKTANREAASFFWPVLMIGFGIVALLVNSGRIATETAWGLVHYWPVLLILGGVDLMFGRRLPGLGALLGLALVGVVVWLLLAGMVPPYSGQHISIGDLDIRTSAVNVKHDRYTAPLDGATRLSLDVQLQQFDTEIGALAEGSSDLVDADLDHFGDVSWVVSGDQERKVAIRPNSAITGFSLTGNNDYRWNVRVARDVPLEILVDVGSGSVLLDLSHLNLETLNLRGGSGEVDALLPQGECSLDYAGGSGDLSVDVAAESRADIHMRTGSGDVQVVVGAGSSATIEMTNGGSGDLRVLVPLGTGVQVQVERQGSGTVRVPEAVAKQTTPTGQLWESRSYANAAQKVSIRVQSHGSGDIIVEYR